MGNIVNNMYGDKFTYHGELFVRHMIVESLCHTPETM